MLLFQLHRFTSVEGSGKIIMNGVLDGLRLGVLR
jgi:hypothetical protein